MKKHTVLIIGSGGREHALGWKLAQSPHVGRLYFAPGNAGTETLGENVPNHVDDIQGLAHFAKTHEIDLTVVGPEAPLAIGIVDEFEKEGVAIFGPTIAATRLESDKGWAAVFMKRYSIPHPDFEAFTSYTKACAYVKKKGASHVVIKANGLAQGKGVILPENDKEAREALDRLMRKKEFGDAGMTVIIQERLSGPEVSLIAVTDGKTIMSLSPSQDHKPVFDGNHGPNTGGMGAYAPVPFVSEQDMRVMQKTILQPTIDGMRKEGHPFKGVVYAGLMITAEGPKVLEYNARFGDPETQPLMMLLSSDLYTLLHAAATGKLSKNLVTFYPGAAACVVLTAKGYPGTYEKGQPISGLATPLDRDMVVFHAGTVKKGKSIETQGGRVLGVTGRGKTLAAALEKTYGAIGREGVHFAGMHYRRDIGHGTLEKSQRELKFATTSARRVEVISTVSDSRATSLSKRLQSRGYRITVTGITDVYTLDAALSEEAWKKAGSMLANPVTQRASIAAPASPTQFDWAIEIGFLPGVTDNVATTAREMVSDGLRRPFQKEEGVYTSQVIFLKGTLSVQKVKALSDSLYNPLIQRAIIKPYRQFIGDHGMGVVVPKVTLSETPNVTTVNLAVADNELVRIGREGIANSDETRRGPLALDLPAMKAIAAYFKKQKRNPTDVELESIAQTWSEHCKHVIFNSPIGDIPEGLFKRYIKRATDEIRKAAGPRDFCVSVFSDNSGAIAFDRDYLITHKVETHNSPSALDPFGGAVTGIVGVNRDALGFGLGAKPIANLYGFCVADPETKGVLYKDKAKTQPMLSPARILDGVIAGINAGGNCSGIPTPQGFVAVDPRYRGKPLVFAGTVGLIPRKIDGKKSYVKKARPGDYIVMMGGRVGLDGIHGATFSSEALTSGSPATAVQIGDPITQKKLSDALIYEARDRGLYTSITDNGAGGLSCSVAEMAKESGGCEVYLEKVPLKYPGLSPWQIWISESQERMTLAVPKAKWVQFERLMSKRGVEATVIGNFTRSGRCVVAYNEEMVMDLSMQFLHDGIPESKLKTQKTASVHPEPKRSQQLSYTQFMMKLLSTPGIASIDAISAQYDHEVQGTSVLKPLQGAGRINGDASVIRPVLSSQKGIALSQALYPTYGDIDMYHMAASSIDTAIRNLLVVGANPKSIALLDNVCWCSARDPHRLAQLKDMARACYDYAVSYGTPYISGKDSMFNDFSGFDEKGNPVQISIPPTLLISSIGIVGDVNSVVSLDAKMPGDFVYILGETYDELGGSAYYTALGGVGRRVPQVNAKQNKVLYEAYFRALTRGLIASGISVGRGGLAVALAKVAIGGGLGLDVQLSTLGNTISDEALLFSESQGRIVVTIAPENKSAFERGIAHIPHARIGTVGGKSVRIHGGKGQSIVECSVDKAHAAYHKPFLPS